MATQRRSTRPERKTSTQDTRDPKNELIHIGGLWEKNNKRVGDYFMGSIGRSENPNDKKTDIDRLKEVLDNLTDEQTLTLLCFYNENSEENPAQPVYKVYVSPYTPGEGGSNGNTTQKRGGRR